VAHRSIVELGALGGSEVVTIVGQAFVRWRTDA
jgi:hypothetical protein